MHEDSLCPGCGHPRNKAWDPQSEGEWEVHEDTCMACQARANLTDGKERAAGAYTTVRYLGAQPAGLDPLVDTPEPPQPGGQPREGEQSH